MKTHYPSDNLIALVLLAAGLLTLISCDLLGSTAIGDIQKNPREYDGKTVTVRGAVAESVSLFGFRYFTLRDDTGEILVIAKKAPPAKGERFTAKGRVNIAFAIGDKSLVVIVEQGP
ncbi:MAG: hypothetical protein ACT4NX_00340 [Deltaproteobacteria bacterium]